MSVDRSKVVYSFEIKQEKVEQVKERCLPGNLNFPMLEEYDFRHDNRTPTVPFDLKQHVRLRPFQDKSLAKMFGNGRARSGIIVLPCGAGKSLVGVAASARVAKSVLVLCQNSMSVEQWRAQFKMWTDIQDQHICRFTSSNKEWFEAGFGVCVTTYYMVTQQTKRAAEAAVVWEKLRNHEWGLLVLDEVHVTPAETFRKVTTVLQSHCKLGLTATLVREDEKITDLNFLIGPKLYDADWLDLAKAGYIANVQCAEVWCPMNMAYYREYLKPQNSCKRHLLYAMNPYKFMATQFLMRYHEEARKDKVIIFSDNIFALKRYGYLLHRPFIYGETSHKERQDVINAFKHSPTLNTILLSKVGDTSLDIPEANVIIQISSHAGSRRQEAQRLGRILRAKKGGAGTAGAAIDNSNGEVFNAFFYSLVSKDTREMYYSSKRQQFLINQGYSFKIVTNLLDSANLEGLKMSTQQEQLDMLSLILSDQATDVAIEGDENGDSIPDSFAKRSAVTSGTLADLSNVQGIMYREHRSQQSKAIKQQNKVENSKRKQLQKERKDFKRKLAKF